MKKNCPQITLITLITKKEKNCPQITQITLITKKKNGPRITLITKKKNGPRITLITLIFFVFFIIRVNLRNLRTNYLLKDGVIYG